MQLTAAVLLSAHAPGCSAAYQAQSTGQSFDLSHSLVWGNGLWLKLDVRTDKYVLKQQIYITETVISPDRIFPGEALNPFFGAQDEEFLEFRSR